MKLTTKSVAALALAPGEKDRIFFDKVVPGWGLRLRAGGGRWWVFQYAIARRTKRMTFGRYPAISVADAREQAGKLHARVALGGDPAGDKTANQVRSGETFDACLRLYLARRRTDGTLRPSSYCVIERHLVCNLANLHGLAIAALDRRTIALELTRLTNAGKLVQSNRTRTSLITFLNWCGGEGFVDNNPALLTNRNPEQPRTRVLTYDELKKIWHALPAGDFGDILKLLTLAGQREREISELAWDEIDFERSIITLPPARTKNRRWHTIPLAPAAIDILKAIEPRQGRRLLFGKGSGGFSNWSHCKNILDDIVKIEPWTIHDLRRSAATHMGELGVQPHVIEACLNHQSGTKGGIVGVYQKQEYAAEKRLALNLWAEHLMAVIEGRESNVQPFKAGRRS
jgi:integrase